jgi:hypothetical protein
MRDSARFRLAACLLLGVYLAWGWARAECLVLCVEADGTLEVQVGYDGACGSCAGESRAAGAGAAWMVEHGAGCCLDGVLLGGDRDRLSTPSKQAWCAPDPADAPRPCCLLSAPSASAAFAALRANGDRRRAWPSSQPGWVMRA